MREIKFIWVCRNIKFNKIHRIELTDEALLKRDYPSWIITDNCEIIAKILPTGLPDKSGKEIYEGDILESNSHLIVIVWDVYFGRNQDYEGTGWCIRSTKTQKTYFLEDSTSENSKIIGNIYEGKELLKPIREK